MWSFSRIGYAIWGITCLVAAVTLLFIRQRPNHGIWKLYTQYLLVHTIVSAIWLIDDGMKENLTEYSTSTGHKVTNWLFNQILLYAARIYFEIGTIVLFRFQRPVHRYLNIFSWVEFMLFSISLCVLTFSVKGFEQGSLLVYAFYCQCALYALVALYIAYCRVLRRDQSSSIAVSAILSDLGIPDSQDTACSCTGKSSNMVLLGVIGGTIGMLDFQLPALEYIGVSLWESSFLGRLLDSLLYVPMIIPCLMWLDSPANYHTADVHP